MKQRSAAKPKIGVFLTNIIARFIRNVRYTTLRVEMYDKKRISRAAALR